MKKLLLVLLVVALAAFLFVGCLPTTPAEGEGEGEGEGEVTVVIEGAAVVDGKTYVPCGSNTITITFPTPVLGGVTAYITECSGDYGKLNGYYGLGIVLFPNADGTVWTGSGDFESDGGCCASYVVVESGECEPEACIWFPVIVDCCYPYAEIKITVEPNTVDDDECSCGDCEITFSSIETDPECAAGVECCDDDCSGIAGWSVVLYDDYPFDVCCDPSICEEPIGSCSGTECPILCVTECLEEKTTPYWAVITLVDNVGLETVYYAAITVTGGVNPGDTCEISVEEYEPAPYPDCEQLVDTGPIVGTCVETCDIVSYVY